MRMEGRFDWHEPTHVDSEESLLPPPDRVGSWMVISLTVAIALHVILFFALGHLKLGVGWKSGEEIVTEPVVVRPVEDDSPAQIAPSPTDIAETPPDRSKLIDEIEILHQLKDPELEMKPEVTEASFDIDIKPRDVAMAGDPIGQSNEIAKAVDFSIDDLQSLGETETYTPVLAEGQMIVDPGSDAIDKNPLDSFMQDLIKKGSAGKALDGKLDGTSTLDEIAGLPENVLVTKTTMLPGDLLFEYNSSQLREQSKVGMQKIALVMDLNPQLYCWIEGHTDLFGGEDFNYDLSLRRAESVKAYLVAMGMNPEKIRTIGIGKNHPIVSKGNPEEQSINRRVEIKMRKTPPLAATPRAKPLTAEPAKATPVEPEALPPPEPPKATPIRVKPSRVLPVEGAETMPAPRATPVVEEAPPRAAPVIEEAPPRAAPVEEIAPPRAQPIEE